MAKLPLDYSDDEFVNLAGAYGKVREAFLMISEKTGMLKLKSVGKSYTIL